MAGNPLDDLANSFLGFPGIGRRQAKRFVFHLLAEPKAKIDKLLKNIELLRSKAAVCADCQRYFLPGNSETLCSVCADRGRDNLILVIEKDTDLENVERAGFYRGRYFILGKLLDPAEEGGQGARFDELFALITKVKPKEIIIALSPTTDGDYTAEELELKLATYKSSGGHLSILGRGLSTGTELEYADPETLKNALSNRKEA